MPTGIHRSLQGRPITEEMRRRLLEKRVEMGVPLKGVASVLGVDWSTVRKWEDGTTKRCSITVRPRLERFLSGDYDALFAGRGARPAMGAGVESVAEDSSPPPGAKPDVPPELQAVFDHAAIVYRACRVRPQAQKELLRGIEASVDGVFARLLEKAE